MSRLLWRETRISLPASSSRALNHGDRTDERHQEQRAADLDRDEIPAEQLRAEMGDMFVGQNIR